MRVMKPKNAPKDPTWNEVKALFESLRHEIGILAEEVRGLGPRLKDVENALTELAKEVRMLATASRTLDQRVTTLEAKLPL